jgi:hypothetical protein
MDWNPWDKFKEDCEVLEIPEPPCKNCIYWKPQREYRESIGGQIFDGVRLCHAKGQQSDFSCFKNKVG